MQTRADIEVTGIVQGIGFRPFVYRIAIKNNLTGYVKNTGDGKVKIVVEGDFQDIEKFLYQLENDIPSIGRIDNKIIKFNKNIKNKRYNKFNIIKSDENKKSKTPIFPPDIAICNKCISELFSKNEYRRYRYPFTSCAECGPRFTTITQLPYDRPNTTMKDFPFCDECYKEYTDPLDRRFHAQTTCCTNCGPQYRVYDRNGFEIPCEDPIKRIAEYIIQNKIVSIMGIGGTHIACKAYEDSIIIRLRNRKKRPSRPFAIMVRSIDDLLEFAKPSEKEIELLQSWRRPIITIKINKNIFSNKNNKFISKYIAPGLDTVGVMLPYTGTHYILFDDLDLPTLVMTSANESGQPMAISQEMAIKYTSGIVDYHLLHNRRIIQRADDSVIKFINEIPTFIRRARGYVPEPIKIPIVSDKIVLSLGAELKNTASILINDKIYQTQHIGDTKNPDNLDFLINAINHFMKIFGIKKPDIVVSDLHPDFYTTELGKELSRKYQAKFVQIQHHFAHALSLMVDNNIPMDQEMITISCDGYGYGNDGTNWGGEIFLNNYNKFNRIATINKVIIPGGDLAAKYPVRTLIAYMKDELDNKIIRKNIFNKKISENRILNENTLQILLKQIDQRINAFESTSLGRFLDATALALGICNENSYEGECPMKLEASARKGDFIIKSDKYIINNKNNNLIILDVKNILREVYEAIEKGISRENIAYAILDAIAVGLSSIAIDLAKTYDVKKIGFTGGVALNTYISEIMKRRIESEKIQYIQHRKIPPGDGGISAGQAIYGIFK